MIQKKLSRWTRIPEYTNPAEMSTGLIAFDDKRCKRCETCMFICPARSILRNSDPISWRDGLPYLKRSEPGITDCVACGCCLAACPHEAIRITRGFNAGHFYQRLSQVPEMEPPHRYLPGEPIKIQTTRSTMTTTKSSSHLPEKKNRNFKQKIQTLRLLLNAVSGLIRFVREEAGRSGWRTTLSGLRQGALEDMSWAELLEERARQVSNKSFLLYKDEAITYKQMDQNANRVANFLLENGGGQGKGIGIYMRNSPRYIDTFIGAQKIGMYVVTINPELKGEGLLYIINHSDIDFLLLDAELIDAYSPVAGQLENVKHVIVNDVETEAEGINLPDSMLKFSRAYGLSTENPKIGYNPDDMCLIIYTSGTTGPPKGVVYRYRRSTVKRLSLIAYMLLKENDVYYTCLALCHGNALLMTLTMTMAIKGTIALSRKFSASRFWEDIRHYHVTLFNTIGSIIPILMKQPKKDTDSKNNVRFVLSAACPAEMWEAFENRFGVTLYEGYGAVDGGGKGILNLGTAPVGSLGKPSGALGKNLRIIDENGLDTPVGVPGELIFKMEDRKSHVEYYKNKDASKEKVRDGWLYTGDLVRKDSEGYLYFVGRNTESMRKGGENVSAYEVEHVIMKHPAVEEVAVYAVPSEMAEDEIMAAITVVTGKKLLPEELNAFLSDKLAKYAIPRFIRIVDEFPKTNSHRIIKGELEKAGVTEDTWDSSKK
ncbi:MAG: AMP-binding protein [Desulfobacterales bacterium]